MENAFPKVIAFLLHCAFAILALCVASTVDASARLQKKRKQNGFFRNVSLCFGVDFRHTGCQFYFIATSLFCSIAMM